MRPVLLAASIVVFAVLTALAAPARADGRFHPVPSSGKATTKLQLRVVAYDGATNGALTVEVKNPTKATLAFSASGLYFVPDGDPDQAPQRLGAVGPMQIAEGDAIERKDSVEVAAGATVRVTLDVFCIDSHRASPTSKTPFTIGKSRMPAQLTATIAKDSATAAAEVGGYAAPAAKAKVQETVWKARDAKWIRLDGEGVQEAVK